MPYIRASVPLASCRCSLLFFSDCHVAPHPPLAPDTVLVGPIIMLDARQSVAEALALKDGRIIAVGTRSGVLGAVDDLARRVRLLGVAVPGLADAR
jgi:hypothetical protein